MGNLALEPVWEPSVRQLETNDPVSGGAAGVDNIAPRQLGNRTEFLERCARVLGHGAIEGLGNVVSVPCGAPYLIEAPWSTGSAATGRPSPMWSSGLGTPRATSRLAFNVPVVSGRVVGVSAHIFCTVTGGVVADVPDNRLQMELVRFEVGYGNVINFVTDDVAAADWYGDRDILFSCPPSQVTPSRAFGVICYLPWDPTATTDHQTLLLTPRVHVLLDE